MADKRLMIEFGKDITQLKTGIREAKSLTDNYTEYAKKQGSELSKFEKEIAGKNAAVLRKIKAQSLSELDHNYKQSLAKAKGNGAELRKIEEQFGRAKKQIHEQTEKAIAGTVAKWKDKAGDQLRAAQAKSVSEQREVSKKILKDLDHQYKEEVRMARKAGQEVASIKKQYQDQRGFVKGRDPIGTKAAPALPGMGGGGGIGQLAQTGAIGMAGSLGSVASKLGPIGIGVGVAAGAIAGLGKTLYEGWKILDDYDDALKELQANMTPDQAQNLEPAMGKLRNTAIDLGMDFKGLRASFGEVIHAIPELKDNFDLAVQSTENFTRASLLLKTDTATLIKTTKALGDAFGINITSIEGQDIILNQLTKTSKIAGISTDELANQAIKSAAAFGSISENGESGLEAVSLLTAAGVKNGLSLEMTERAARAFADTLGDTKKRTDLVAQGLEGIDAQTGKVTDWTVLFDSIAAKGGEMADAFGSADILITQMSKNGGAGLKDLQSKFGAVGVDYKAMSQSIVDSHEKLPVMWEDLKLTIAQSAGGVIGALEGMAIGAMGAINDFFMSGERQYQKLNKEAEGFTQLANKTDVSLMKVNAALQDVQNIKPGDAAKLFKDIGGELGEISTKLGPEAAARLQEALSGKGDLGIVLADVKEKLEALNGMARANETAKALESQEAAGAAMNDILDDQTTFWEDVDNFSKKAAATIGAAAVGFATGGPAGVAMALALKDAAEAGAENVDQIAQLEEKATATRAQFDLLIERSKGMSKSSQEYKDTMLEAQSVSKDLARVEGGREQINKGIGDLAKRTLDSQLKINGGMAEQVDLETAVQNALLNVSSELQQSGEFQKRIRESIEKELGPMQQKAAMVTQIKEIEAAAGAEREELVRKLTGYNNSDEAYQTAINTSKEAGIDLEKEILAIKEKALANELETLQIIAKNSGLLSEEQQARLAILQAKQDAALQSEQDKNYTAQKNVLLIDQQVLETAISAATAETLNNDTLSNEQKTVALQSMIELNNQRIAELQSSTILSAAQLAQIDNLKAANAIITQKIAGVNAETKAEQLLVGMVDQEVVSRQKALVEQKKQAETTNMQADLELKTLELQLAQGEISDTEFQEKSLEIVHKRIEAEQKLLQTMIAGKANEKDILQQKMKVLDLQKSGAEGKSQAAKEIKSKQQETENKYIETEKKHEEERKKLRAEQLQDQLQEIDRQNEIAQARYDAEMQYIKGIIAYKDQLNTIINELKGKGFSAIKGIADKFLTLDQQLMQTVQQIREGTQKDLQGFAQMSDKAMETAAGVARVMQDVKIKERQAYGKASNMMSGRGTPEDKKAVDDYNTAVAALNLKMVEQNAILKTATAEWELLTGQHITTGEFLGKAIDYFNTKAQKAVKLSPVLVSDFAKLMGELAEIANEYSITIDNYKKLEDSYEQAFSIDNIEDFDVAISNLNNEVAQYQNALKIYHMDLDSIAEKYKLTVDDLIAKMAEAPEYFSEGDRAQLHSLLLLKEQAEKEKGILEDKQAEIVLQRKNIDNSEKLAEIQDDYKAVADEVNTILQDESNTYGEISDSYAKLAQKQGEVAKATADQLIIERDLLNGKKDALEFTQKELTATNTQIDLVQAELLANGQKIVDNTILLGQQDALNKKLLDQKAVLKGLADSSGKIKADQTFLYEYALKTSEKYQELTEKVNEAQRVINTGVSNWASDAMRDDENVQKQIKEDEEKLAAAKEALSVERKKIADANLISPKDAKILEDEKAARDSANKDIETTNSELKKTETQLVENNKLTNKNADTLAKMGKLQQEAKLLGEEVKEQTEDVNKGEEKLLTTKEKAAKQAKEAADAQKKADEARLKFIKGIGEYQEKNAIDFITSLKSEMSSISEAIEGGTPEDMAKAFVGLATVASNATNAVFETIEQFNELKGMFKGGADVGGGITKVADITMKVGQALLNSKNPQIAIAGAIILGVGIIAKAVGRIYSAIHGKEQTSLEKAEERAAEELLITETLQRELDLMEKLNALGDKQLDQAYERHKAEKALLDDYIAQHSELKNMTVDQALAQKAALEAKLKASEAAVTKAEGGMESWSGKQRADFMKSQGFDVGEYGTKAELKDWITRHKGVNAQLQDDIDILDTFITGSENLIGLSKEVVEDNLTIAKMQLDILESTGASAADMAIAVGNVLSAQRALLQLAFKDLQGEDIFNFANMTNEQIADQIEAWALIAPDILQTTMNIGTEQMAAMQEWLETYNSGTESILQANVNDWKIKLDELKHKLEMGMIGEFEYNEKLVDLLKGQLVDEKAILDTLVAQGAAKGKIDEQTQKIWQLEEQIRDEGFTEDENLRRKTEHLKRQQDMLLATGQITEAEHKEAITNILETQLAEEQRILSELEMQGATNFEIYTQKERIWDMEKEIYDVIHGQNELEDERLQKAKELNRQRTMLLMAAKAGLPADMTQVGNLETQIMDLLRASGATDAQLAAQMETFRNTMPQYAYGSQGGERTQEGVHYLHAGEAVLNPAATANLDAAFPGWIDWLNAEPGAETIAKLSGALTNSKASLEMAKISYNNSITNNVNMGGIKILVQSGANPKQIAEEAYYVFEKNLQGKGIQIGQL